MTPAEAVVACFAGGLVLGGALGAWFVLVLLDVLLAHRRGEEAQS